MKPSSENPNANHTTQRCRCLAGARFPATMREDSSWYPYGQEPRGRNPYYRFLVWVNRSTLSKRLYRFLWLIVVGGFVLEFVFLQTFYSSPTRGVLCVCVCLCEFSEKKFHGGVRLRFSIGYPWLRKFWSKTTYPWLRTISWFWARSYVI